MQRDDVEVVLRCLDRIELLAGIRAGELDAVVAVGPPPWMDDPLLSELRSSGVLLVGVALSVADQEWFSERQITHAGRDATIDRILQLCRAKPSEPILGSPSPVVAGKTFAVWGAKGAPGATRVAIELAFEIARGNVETILVDADPYGGDIDQLLGFDEDVPSLLWVAQMAEKRADPSVWRDEIKGLSRGPHVLPGLVRPALWADVPVRGWCALLERLPDIFDAVVIDTGLGLNGMSQDRDRLTVEAISAADRVVAVLRADALGVKHFIWHWERLTELVDPELISVVANRVRAEDKRELGDLLSMYTGKRPVAFIPDAPRSVGQAVSEARAVSESDSRSELSAAIRTLASTLGFEVPALSRLNALIGRA